MPKKLKFDKIDERVIFISENNNLQKKKQQKN